MAILTWQGILALLLGGLYGAIFGSIPGLTATLAVALFIPIAFFLDPVLALPAIIAISSVAIYAGDVGSVVARIPGTPASAAYVEELSTVARRKGPIYALGISAMGSAVGGVIGTIILIFSATGLAAVAKNFSSFEYFWIAVLGLTAGVFASGGSPLKGLVSLLIGLFFSTIGIDPTLGYPRFSFGNSNLLGGLNYIVAMIGLFGFSEVLEHLYGSSTKRYVAAPGSRAETLAKFYLRPLRLIARNFWLVLRSALLGTFVGFLPGAGADIGAWVASSLQKMLGMRRRTMMAARGAVGDRADELDEGLVDEGLVYEGSERELDQVVLAGTSSNNAVASAWIPALSLGLPGDTVTAIVLGVFLMKGITPGPLLFQNDPGLVWALYSTFLISSVVLLPVFGYLTARLAALVVRIPLNLLLSLITALCVVGAFAINNNPFDVWVMVAMGIFAFILKRGGFPLAQVVLGMVLGPILEQNFVVSAIKARWNFTAFFDRPVAIALMLATIVLIIVGLRIRIRASSEGPA